jgi:hypothetical protein
MLYLENDVVISECGQYRYLLRRVWDQAKPRALFIGLNPAATNDNPTIRSCVRLANSLGYGSIELVNIFGWRATDPNELAKQSDPTGPLNDNSVAAAIARCDVVICAWGASAMATRQAAFLSTLIRSGAFCLGTTKSGAPKHPLYIKSGTALRPYQPRELLEAAE